MAEFSLAPRLPLPGPSRAGHDRADAAVTLAIQPDGRHIILLARRGQAEALAEHCQGFGVVLPATPQRIESRGVAVVWTGPGQWLVDGEERDVGRAERLFASSASLCTLVRADDARTRIVIGGPRSREVLSKILPIDLHPRAFRPGDAAVTVAGGISVVIWRRDDDPLFECAVPRSFARSFWEWLLDSAAEYGVAVEATPG